MTKKTRKELLASAPWRVEEDDNSDKFKDGNLKVKTKSDGSSTMYVPGTKKNKNKNDNNNYDEDSLTEIDPQLRYSFQRNFQFIQRVFSIDTLVKPLPPLVAYNVSRNLSFFTRIFTQFIDPDGIANAQKSLGIGQEEKVRRVG